MNKEQKPILLSRQTAILIMLYHHDTSFLEMCMSDYEAKDPIELSKKSARELIDQLQDHWTPRFLIDLRDEITKELEKHDKDYGTSFSAPTRKDEE